MTEPTSEEIVYVSRSPGLRGPKPKPHPAGIFSPTKLAHIMGVSRQRAEQILHPEKYRARNAVKYALASGKLIRDAVCCKCLRPHDHLEAHHSDYQRQLDVQWLCRVCHNLVHPHPRRRV